MYIAPTASDQAAAGASRAVGAEPLGLICCQALPCVPRSGGKHHETLQGVSVNILAKAATVQYKGLEGLLL